MNSAAAAQQWAETQAFYKDFPRMSATRFTLREEPANRHFPVTEVQNRISSGEPPLDLALVEQGAGRNPLFVFFSSPSPPFEALAAGSCDSVECDLYRRSNYFCYEDASGTSTTPLASGEGRYCTNVRCQTKEGGADYIDVLGVRAPTTQAEAETLISLLTHVACEANNDVVILATGAAAAEPQAPSFEAAVESVIYGNEGYIRELILA